MAAAIVGPAASLTFFELENFKSFRGRVSIPSFDKLTSIVGKNGVGKSNLLDAFGFVLGCDESLSRIQHNHDLMTGGLVTDNPTSVTVCFTRNGVLSSFKKVITGDVIEHFFNDEEVIHEVYRAALDDIGFENVREHFSNGFNFQAILSPDKMTKLLERVSGSGKLVRRYDDAAAEVLVLTRRVAELVTSYNQMKSETRLCTKHVKAHGEFQRHKNQMVFKQKEFYLFKLFHLEREINDLETVEHQIVEEIEEKRQKLTTIVNEKERNVDETDNLQELLEITTSDLETESKKAFDLRLEVQQAAVTWDHNRNMFEICRHMLSVAQSAQVLVEEMDERLMARLTIMVTKRDWLIAHKPAEFSMKHVMFTVEQMQEYSILSSQVAKQNRTDQVELDYLVAGRREMLQQFKALESTQNSLQDQLRSKQTDLIHNYQRMLNLGYHYVTDSRVTDLDNAISKKEGIISRAKLIRIELEKIDNDMLCVKLDEKKKIRKRWLDELIGDLRQAFPESVVYGCIQELHERDRVSSYWPLVDDILHPYLDTIIVDSRATRKACVAFVEERKSGEATFIAIDDIDIVPLLNKLYTLRDSGKCVPFYDKLLIGDNDVKPVFMHLTKDVVIVPTNESKHNLNCDGDLLVVTAHDNYRHFQKHGSVLGSVSIDQAERRQREWPPEEVRELVRRQQDLNLELADIQTLKIDKNDCDMLRRQREDLVAKRGNNSIGKECEELETDIAKVKADILTLEPELQNTQEEVRELDERIDTIRNRIGTTENEVFTGFCREVGVVNIREFDGLGPNVHEWSGELSQLTLRLEKLRMESNLKLSNVWNESESIWKKDFSKYEEKVNADTPLRLEAEESVRRATETLNEKREMAKKLTLDLKEKQSEAQSLECKRRLAANDVSMVEQLQDSHLQSIMQKRISRHICLKACKVEDQLQLPMTAGSMEDVSLAEMRYINEEPCYDDETIVMLDRESDFRFNYDSLSEEMKNLTSSKEVEQCEKALLDSLNISLSKLRGLRGPDSDAADDRHAQLNHRLLRVTEDLESMSAGLQEASDCFTEASRERRKCYMACFREVSRQLNIIYQNMNESTNAQAQLVPINENEQYLDGTLFTTVVPNKFPRTVDSLSTGEKTLASLAFFFAIHKYNPSPMIFLDDVGSNLDDSKTEKVARFIKRHSVAGGVQTIIVSQSVHVDQYCDTVIGLFQSHLEDVGAKLITFNVSEFSV